MGRMPQKEQAEGLPFQGQVLRVSNLTPDGIWVTVVSRLKLEVRKFASMPHEHLIGLRKLFQE